MDRESERAIIRKVGRVLLGAAAVWLFVVGVLIAIATSTQAAPLGPCELRTAKSATAAARAACRAYVAGLTVAGPSILLDDAEVGWAHVQLVSAAAERRSVTLPANLVWTLANDEGVLSRAIRAVRDDRYWPKLGEVGWMTPAWWAAWPTFTRDDMAPNGGLIPGVEPEPPSPPAGP